MRIDIAKNAFENKNTGVLSRCKVCGRYFSWECPTRLIYVDLKTGKKKASYEPNHCGSTVCSDFWDYYQECRTREMNDFEMAKAMYLKRKGIL